MIDPKLLKRDPEAYRRNVLARGTQFGTAVDRALKHFSPDGQTSRSELERLQHHINVANAVVPKLQGDEKKEKIAELRKISDRITALKQAIPDDWGNMGRKLPNWVKDDVPIGQDESANQILRQVGEKPSIDQPKDYLTLAEPLGIIDIQRAGKVSGSRFGYILGPAAQLEFALLQYAQSLLLPEGFIPVVPPVMIKEDNMAAMGYLAGGGEKETYHFEKDGLYLVGTSEQSIGPMHRDEVFEEQQLPRRYLSFSTCFRREAGSYGKDTKGILRVHQFDKLEMFSFATPEKSDREHDFLLSMEEKLMQGLKLPYRVVKLCSGDLGFPSARTYDLEAWMPGQGTFRETHSTSTTTDYQSRDLKIRFQRGNKRELVHMLNGTAFAIGRTLIAIIENYQQADGSVVIPEVLTPYMNGLTVIQHGQTAANVD